MPKCWLPWRKCGFCAFSATVTILRPSTCAESGADDDVPS